ncbi:MAG: TadE family protein [Actinomycetota bacterium]
MLDYAKTCRRSAGDRGVTAVEFAIILPLLLLLVFGIIEFGRAYQARLTVTHAAREGVRVLAVTENQAAAEAAALAATTGLDAGSVSVTGTPCAAGLPAEMVVTYPVTIEIPGTGVHSFTLTGRAVMTCLD